MSALNNITTAINSIPKLISSKVTINKTHAYVLLFLTGATVIGGIIYKVYNKFWTRPSNSGKLTQLPFLPKATNSTSTTSSQSPSKTTPTKTSTPASSSTSTSTPPSQITSDTTSKKTSETSLSSTPASTTSAQITSDTTSNKTSEPTPSSTTASTTSSQSPSKTTPTETSTPTQSPRKVKVTTKNTNTGWGNTLCANGSPMTNLTEDSWQVEIEVTEENKIELTNVLGNSRTEVLATLKLKDDQTEIVYTRNSDRKS